MFDYQKLSEKSISEIKNITKPKNVFISGGVSRSKNWVKILQQNTDFLLKPRCSRSSALIGAVKIYKNGKYWWALKSEYYRYFSE